MTDFNLDNMDKNVAKAITDVYKHFAKVCPALFEHSFVAGGAIRDSILGQPVKDIDIFVNITTLDYNIQEQIGNYISANCVAAGKEYEEMDKFIVYNIGVFNKYNVQLIVNTSDKSIIDTLARFGVSLSRCAFLPMQNKVTVTTSFKYSVETKRLLFSKHSPEDYVNRIRAKYPTYKASGYR